MGRGILAGMRCESHSALRDAVWYPANSSAYRGPRRVQRLLEVVPGTCPGEQQELPHPAHQVRLVRIHCQVFVLKELGIAVKDFEWTTITFGHISVPVLCRSA
jgi:hypothetical protein